MNMEQEERLQRKYDEGMTSLSEERSLFEQALTGSERDRHWFGYIREKRSRVPGNIEELALSAVESYRRRTRRLIISTASAAATIALLVTIGVGTKNYQAREMEKEEILATLEEVMSMVEFDTRPGNKGQVLYEDESIIIYME